MLNKIQTIHTWWNGETNEILKEWIWLWHWLEIKSFIIKIGQIPNKASQNFSITCFILTFGLLRNLLPRNGRKHGDSWIFIKKWQILNNFVLFILALFDFFVLPLPPKLILNSFLYILRNFWLQPLFLFLLDFEIDCLFWPYKTLYSIVILCVISYSNWVACSTWWSFFSVLAVCGLGKWLRNYIIAIGVKPFQNGSQAIFLTLIPLFNVMGYSRVTLTFWQE